MKKNMLLRAVTLILKLVCVIAIILFIVNSVILIHWHINPDFYSDFNLITNEGPNSFFGLGYSVKETYTIGERAIENPFTLDNLKYYSFYLIYFQVSTILLLIFLISVEFIKIINSVRMIQSFRKQNILSFRKIGKCLFVLFFLLSFKKFSVEMGEYFVFAPQFSLLLLMLIAFVLAEIFKEGNALLEENKLTI